MKKIFTLFRNFCLFTHTAQCQRPGSYRWQHLHGRYPLSLQSRPRNLLHRHSFLWSQRHESLLFGNRRYQSLSLFPIGLGSGFGWLRAKALPTWPPKSKEGSRYFAGTNADFFRYFGSYRNSGTRMCGRRPIGESSRIFGPSNIFHDKRRMLHLVRHLCR